MNAVLNGYLSKLRRVLADGDGDAVLATQAPGYVLRVPAERLDARRFEGLFQEGREALARGDADQAAASLRAALALWRGPALADLVDQQFAQSEIRRLDELRLAALEDRIDADLALGRHDALVAELETLVAENPYRERLQGQLLLALYRSGRQAEALEAYQRARRTLLGELGIAPGPRLQELERAILRQDPALDVEAPAPARVREVAQRSILVAIADETHIDALLVVAESLARQPSRIVILARLVSDAAELRSASAWLEKRRSALEARGVVARAASCTSTAPGEELARLASELNVDLLLADAPMSS